MQNILEYYKGVARAGGRQGRGSALVSRRKGLGAVERQDPKNMSGQALIMLLFFIMIGITITTTAIYIIAGNSLSATDVNEGEVARAMAEAGAENALLQVLRGNYANENITLPDGTVTVTITNGATITIDSVGTVGNYIKKVRVTATKDGMMDVTSWKEVN